MAAGDEELDVALDDVDIPTTTWTSRKTSTTAPARWWSLADSDTTTV